jgi:hypothetical protein
MTRTTPEGWLTRASGTIVTRRTTTYRADGSPVVAYERDWVYGAPSDSMALFLSVWTRPVGTGIVIDPPSGARLEEGRERLPRPRRGGRTP